MTQLVLDAAGAHLDADVEVPDGAVGVVLFAHGSGSSRHSPRNRAVASFLNERRLATVLMDLLTEDEDRADGGPRFDIGLLAERLVGAVDRLRAEPATAGLPLGLFGASTGGAAALVAAAARPDAVRAVVSRGGRPDLARAALAEVRAPTLLIVGELDPMVADLNERARSVLGAPSELRIVPGASHLFEEPGTLEEVSLQAADWFTGALPE
ncbi:dienelactone hydrolase family protein [Actinophytocola sp. NPDC049390]|uniref:dienelactone hydrolase family protein n=1 Tax=Actinophytocola sp. NPDC049390 TaxID=3363894 RepID=UPI003791C64C